MSVKRKPTYSGKSVVRPVSVINKLRKRLDLCVGETLNVNSEYKN